MDVEPSSADSPERQTADGQRWERRWRRAAMHDAGASWRRRLPRCMMAASASARLRAVLAVPAVFQRRCWLESLPRDARSGRNRFHTDWKEPKLLMRTSSATTGDRLRRGPRSSTHAPGTGGGLRPAVVEKHARQIGLNAADKVLFIADGAPESGNACQRRSPRSGSLADTGLQLIDFYHAAKQLSDAVASCAARARRNAPAGS